MLAVAGGIDAYTSIFHDDFERADQIGLGTAPTGQVWALTGAGGATAQIQSGRYTDGTPGANNTSYAGVIISPQPQRIGGTFSFVPGSGGGTGAAIALIASSDTSITLQHMVHLVLSQANASLSWWQNGSQNQTPASCSAPTGYAFRTPLAADGTVYSVWMSISGNTVHVDLPDGGSFDCTDSHFSTLWGSLGIWEHVYNNTSTSISRWESVGSSQATTSTLYGTLAVPGGLQNTPIGTNGQSVVYATQIGVGTTTPTAGLEIFKNSGVFGAGGLLVDATNNLPTVTIRAWRAS